ncbi:MAG: MFS family permease, partial [Paracoccaceae bacterium]
AANRYHRPRLMACGLLLWSALTMVTGNTKNFIQMAATRVFIGVGEATLTPACWVM